MTTCDITLVGTDVSFFHEEQVQEDADSTPVVLQLYLNSMFPDPPDEGVCSQSTEEGLVDGIWTEMNVYLDGRYVGGDEGCLVNHYLAPDGVEEILTLQTEVDLDGFGEGHHDLSVEVLRPDSGLGVIDCTGTVTVGEPGSSPLVPLALVGVGVVAYYYYRND